MFGTDAFEDGMSVALYESTVCRARELGILRYDTAPEYGRGQAERMLGVSLSSDSDRIQVSTKACPPPWTGSDAEICEGLLRSVSESLTRLEKAQVDVLLVRPPGGPSGIAGVVRAMGHALEAGFAKSVGLSNWPPSALRRLDLRQLPEGVPSVVGVPLSMFARRGERDVIPWARDHGCKVWAWSPLNGGWLSGKYASDVTAPAGSRLVRRLGPTLAAIELTRPPTREKLSILPAVTELASRAGCSLPQFALQWVLSLGVDAVALGARTPDQLGELVTGLDDPVEPALLAAVDRLIPPGQNIDPVDDGFSRKRRLLEWTSDD